MSNWPSKVDQQTEVALSRYQGKPFLRFLDCYVLSSIGHLDDEQEHTLNLMTPKFSDALGIQGSWFEIVSQQMNFPANLPDKIRTIWENGKNAAAERGVSVDPHEFTRQFVDTNFPI